MKYYIMMFLFLALVGCSTSDIDRVNAISSNAHHIGKIIEKDEVRNRILVDELAVSIDRDEPSLIWFSTSDETDLLDKRDNIINFRKLRKGDLVEVWNDGVILESYPGQALAIKIKLIP